MDIVRSQARCDTTTDRAIDRKPVDYCAGICHGLANSFGHRIAGFNSRARQNGGKLLTTQATDQIARPQHSSTYLDECLQNPVAGRMTKTIIDRFETIEVKGHDGNRRVVASTALQDALG